MRTLEASSNEIFEIVDLIEGIASQSKLLALNAAIEAAHAGEAGAGSARARSRDSGWTGASSERAFRNVVVLGDLRYDRRGGS